MADAAWCGFRDGGQILQRERKQVLMKTLIFLFLSIAGTVPAFAADVTAERVDHLLAGFDKPGSAGCSVGVIRNGRFIYKKSFGYASLELGVPLTPQSVFYVGSVSKQFTAASVVLAAEQDYLSLDDDVRKYLPELPDYGHPVTLRQMLHQTSGIRDFFDLIALSGGNPAEIGSPADILKLIVRQKGLNNVPGAEWNYSNSNYFLLAEVVQRATKKSLARFAAESIFQPLGMKHTLFFDDNTLVVPNRVAAYDPGKDGKFLVDWSTSYNLVGGGGVMSTVDDLLLWDRNFYSNKLGKGTLVQQLQNHGVLNNGNQINYALGLMLEDYRGLPTVEHSGANFGYRSEYLRFPQQRFSAILLCNLSTAGPVGLAHKISDLYLEGDLAPNSAPRVSPGFPNPETHAGTYLDPHTKTIYNFTVEGGNLMGWGEALQPVAANQYYDLQGDVMTFSSNNGVMHLSLPIPGELYFSGDRIEPLKLSAVELSGFAGNFHSEELDTSYTLSVEGGHLTVKVPNNPSIPLDAAGRDEFYSNDLGDLVFHTDAGDRVSAFSLSTQASRGIIFAKVN
jgi:CubicO group peptidase (beta-lactamase class C family)